MEGLEDPFLSEFLRHPSYNPVATFFLGFVFISCVHFTFHVPLAAVRRIRSYVLNCRVPHGGVGLEANRTSRDEKDQTWFSSNRTNHATSSSIRTYPKSNNLALSLTVCLAMASLADFGTLLVFNQSSGTAGCAFLVAWGGIASQAARLLGLLKLSLDLRRLGVHRWESFVFWAWLVAALVLMFASNALSIGTLKFLPHSNHYAICARKHYLITSVLTSVLDIIPEVYSLFRIYTLIVPAFLSPRHKFDALLDVRVSRALSLLILDLVTAVPAAHFFNTLADFIPGSLGALLVLAAFNQRSPHVTLASTASIPGTRADSIRSLSTIEIKKVPSSRSLVDSQQHISHPFAASALQDPSPETEDWPESASPKEPEKQQYISFPEATASPRGKRQTWRTSNQSAVSESDSDVARSVKGAIVGFAFKDMIGPSRRPRERSFLPHIPTASEPLPSARAEVLPRSTPLRVPRPVVPPQPQHVEALERAMRYERDRHVPASLSPTALPPHIAVTSASPVDAPSAPRTPSSRPSITISVPGSTTTSTSSSGGGGGRSSNESVKSSSLHLTPSTPAPSQQPSRRASSDSDWRYDAQRDSYGSQPSSSEGTSQHLQHLQQQQQQQRHSGGSGRLPPADDDLSIVYEASHEDSDSVPPSRAYRPTFGEHMFVEGGIGRPISTPVGGVPEDVQEGGQSNGSPSSNSSAKP